MQNNPLIEEPPHRISKSAISVWRISSALWHVFFLALFGGLAYAAHRFDWIRWVEVSLYIALGLTAVSAVYGIFLSPWLRGRSWRYGIDSEYIHLQHGRLFKVNTLVPMTKVEYVRVEQGPLLRRFGLFEIQLGTVTSSHTIPGLPEETASVLRSQIAALAKLRDDDEEIDTPAVGEGSVAGEESEASVDDR